mmetsp:Transcript_34702/g.53223  ORF Transcript_34702/g.53223 Transcript_34702/m.53223 type:complete len:126 (-) Transcript_34702:775-1152(-)
MNLIRDNECFAIRLRFRKREKSSKILVLYFCLMVSMFAYVKFLVLHPLEVVDKVWEVTETTGLIFECLFYSCLFLTTVLSLMDPGYLKRECDDEDAFLRLLIKYDPASLCPDCQVLKTVRSRHCY